MFKSETDIPEGFLPIWSYHYQDGTEVKTLAKTSLGWQKRADGLITRFYINKDKKIPVLPFKTYGDLWHAGWDIPTKYVIDADKQVWLDNAHGGDLCLVSSKILFSKCKDVENRNYFRKLLNILPLEEPEWMIKARENGWQPPEEVEGIEGVIR